jgi:hypothetical protein
LWSDMVVRLGQDSVSAQALRHQTIMPPCAQRQYPRPMTLDHPTPQEERVLIERAVALARQCVSQEILASLAAASKPLSSS